MAEYKRNQQNLIKKRKKKKEKIGENVRKKYE